MAEIRQQLQCGDSPAQRAGSPSLEAAVSPENPIYQGALAGTDYTARDASTRNDSATQRADTGKIRGICSPGVLPIDELLARLDQLAATKAGEPIPTFLETPNGWGVELSSLAKQAASLLRLRTMSIDEADRRLASALHDAGRSALGMPGTVDTLKAMLHRAGLTLVLA